jgi:type VII secretion-associated serine protease mycosin
VRWRRLALTVSLLAPAVLLPAVPAYADQERNAQWYLSYLHVAEAQRISQGDGVIVGVLDTGVDASHPDLAGNVLPGTDFVDSGGDGHRDNDGHGTEVAGLVAAHGRGTSGILGIAPRAKILPVRSHTRINVGDLPTAINWAVDHGAKVICIASSGSDEPLLHHAVDRAIAADVVVVAGVGNRPTDLRVTFPAAYSGVLAAAGIDRNGNHADVSVTGPEAVLAAPAVDVNATYPGGRYITNNGTSLSTAILAGAAALVRARFPGLSAEEVVHRLTATAIDKGTPGRDDEYGYGVMDLVAALTKDVPPLKPSAEPTTATTFPSAVGQPKQNRQAPLPLLVLGAALVVVIVIGVVVAVRRRR